MIDTTRASRHPRFIVPLTLIMSVTAAVDARAQWIQAQQILPPPGQPPGQQVQAPVQQNLAPSAAPPSSIPAGPPPASVPTAPPPSNPGLVEELGKIIRNSASGLSSTWKGSQQTIDAIGSGAQGAVSGAAKGATDAILSTTSQTMVTGRSACPIAGNGAPDCKSASEQLCKGKGYRTGSSVDIETAETCSAKVYISGRTGAPGECKTQNFVTRAVCQ